MPFRIQYPPHFKELQILFDRLVGGGEIIPLWSCVVFGFLLYGHQPLKIKHLQLPCKDFHEEGKRKKR